MTTADNSAFINGWQSAQQEYWKNWWDMAKQATESLQGSEVHSSIWHEGLEIWSRLFRAPRSVPQDLMDKIMLNAKQYMTIMQSTLNRRLDQPPLFFDQNAAANPWIDLMKKSSNILGMDRNDFFNNPFANVMRENIEKNAKIFQHWMPEIEKLTAPFQHQAKSLLSTPAFGYLREHQEHYQKMAQAWMEYQEALHRYNVLMMKCHQRSFDIFESKLAERAEPGRQLDSVRGLYDLWVDAAEEAYAEIALSEEFREVYGNVINEQMRFRSQIQQEVERMSVDFGMPTRTELNSVHQRLHEVRRELRRQQELPDLTQEVASLRAEVAALKKNISDQTKDPRKNVAERAFPRKAVKTSRSTKR